MTPVSKRNRLTQKQTKALIKLWDKWKPRNTLPRLALSPYSIPYISIERRDDDPTLGNWDWCITYHGEYSDRRVWYSNSKEPMDDVIRTFLRKSYDTEFMSIHQTNL